jgi:hypothetical protein
MQEPGGKCITLAWNFQGTGKGLGFEIRILLVAHGGNRNDTIVTVDRKSIKVKIE